MNPPYSNGNDGLHLQFTGKCINLADNTICLMPFSFISVKSSTNKKYIPKLEKQLVDVVEIDSNAFIDTHMANVGIYTFSSIAPANISITYLDNKSIKVKTLNDIQQFNKYEMQIETIIKNNGSNSCVSTPYYEKNNLNIATNISKTFPNNKTILVCSSVNGKMDAKFFSNKIGQIFNVNNEFINFLMSSTSLTPYNYLLFDNNIAAKNCKNALLNPLMRFFLAKTQDNQRMPKGKCFKYIPNIDWSDPRVVTDEGLLEVCGCPKDKCKKYAEYCRKYMEEFDKQHQSKKKKVK